MTITAPTTAGTAGAQPAVAEQAPPAPSPVAGYGDGPRARSMPGRGAVEIRLLGPPVIEQHGRAVRPPRGRKVWALLCYLVLADRAPCRRHLADLLFDGADDPMGALRWILAELRRALAAPDVFRGDPVDTTLGDDVWVDVLLLTRAPAGPDRSLLELDGELLEGVELTAAPGFESWLRVQRHRVATAHEARLRDAAAARLAAGQADDAVRYASYAVARNPLAEGNHELLVRALVMVGDHAAARRQLFLADDLLRREFGVGASASLQAAAGKPAGKAHTSAPRTGSTAPEMFATALRGSRGGPLWKSNGTRSPAAGRTFARGSRNDQAYDQA
ncbi:hypothetical protein I6A84_14715 [Frankia sp. CNm7]|uniref:Bacterial transcriptional activator domain-containing protein n=1 Tax=Frankia nepalensis TaxID=1836974 RepID=A0A937RUG9_9ACTN|nr:BTAD domain-containing putative transcriptional regulator [Frankia nepalensis]MBL7500261.1 hypothetical protein [Frankia nepalensis]MBL7513537.1 hypothetical protein [Frankia nepalensis]MBL7519321.1 hypothetical protein [Frankia nepalensis]MBL7633038.1 hypothetical protein [Frankia nepalensis]